MDGRHAYVANEVSGDVSVVDLTDHRVVTTIPVGQAPRKIAVQPSRQGAAAWEAPLQVEAEDYAFRPASLTGRPGQTLRLRVTSRSSTLHNVSVPTQGIDRDLAPGQSLEVMVAVPASGTAPFFCKFHVALGQRGQLIAVETRPPSR